MDDIFVCLLLLAIAVCIVSVIGFIVKWVMKKPKKKWGIVAVIAFVSFCAIGFLWGAISCNHETDTTQQPTTEQETNTTSQPTKEPETTEPEKVDTSTTYEEIYRAYKANELRADDTYKNNRYRVTAKINGMATGGLFNLTGGATLTMEIRIDNTIVFFYAEFEKEQEEALKTVNVGDTITFEGECLSAGTWVECELIQ